MPPISRSMMYFFMGVSGANRRASASADGARFTAIPRRAE
jgi:hypothetical protein